MSFSLLKFLGLEKNELPAILILHNNFIVAAQVEMKDGKAKLLGFNEMPIAQEVFEEGEVFNPDEFKKILKDLLKNAKPNAIKAKSLFINIPSDKVFPFTKEFSHVISDDVAESSMREHIQKTSPINFDELSLYVNSNKDEVYTYGVSAVPKRWEKRIGSICKEIGIKRCEFYPEPYARLALVDDELPKNFTLFSFHEDRIFVSIFYNKVLYDNYFMSIRMKDGQINCAACFQEFLVSKEAFKNQFNKDIDNMYFVGFPKDFHKNITDFLAARKIGHKFIDDKKSKFYKLFPAKQDVITLIGLLEKLLRKS